jgi:predicted amidophosphoribosyltransferase
MAEEKQYCRTCGTEIYYGTQCSDCEDKNKYDTCSCCGKQIPKGMQVCDYCWKGDGLIK